MSAFSCERAASSVLESRALSSACLVSCWSVVFGSRHSRSSFCHRVSVRSRVRSAPRTLVHVCFVVARSSCFYRLRAFMLYHKCISFMLYHICGTQLVYSLAACFHVVMSCVNTWLMSFLISCMFMSCFAHGW